IAPEATSGAVSRSAPGIFNSTSGWLRKKPLATTRFALRSNGAIVTGSPLLHALSVLLQAPCPLQALTPAHSTTSPPALSAARTGTVPDRMRAAAALAISQPFVTRSMGILLAYAASDARRSCRALPSPSPFVPGGPPVTRTHAVTFAPRLGNSPEGMGERTPGAGGDSVERRGVHNALTANRNGMTQYGATASRGSWHPRDDYRPARCGASRARFARDLQSIGQRRQRGALGDQAGAARVGRHGAERRPRGAVPRPCLVGLSGRCRRELGEGDHRDASAGTAAVARVCRFRRSGH